MKHIFASSILISLLLIASLSYARKEPGDYWKSIMKDKAMPKALQDLYHHDDDQRIKTDHFVKDFDRKSSSVSIIYHRRSETKAEKQQEEEKPFKKQQKVPAHTRDLEKNLNQLHN